MKFLWIPRFLPQFTMSRRALSLEQLKGADELGTGSLVDCCCCEEKTGVLDRLANYSVG